MGTERPARQSGRVPRYLRLAIWVFAVPFGFIVTAVPAWRLALIRKSDVLDVFIRSGVGRFERLGLGVIIWSLVTAGAVQLSITIVARRRSVQSEPRQTASDKRSSRPRPTRPENCAADIKPQM